MDVNEVIRSYGLIILEFLFEFYVFYAMVVRKLQKRDNFYARLILSVVVVLVVSIPLAVFYTGYGHFVWGRTITYFLLFVLLFFQGKVLFEEPLLTILFVSSVAYCAQNLVYKGYLLQYYFGKLMGLYGFSDKFIGTLEYRLMYYTVFSLFACALWFSILKSISQKISVDKLNWKIFLWTLVILAVSVMLCSIADIYFENSGMGVANGSYEFNNMFVLRQAENAIFVLFGITNLLLMSKTLEEKDLQREIKELQYAIRQSEHQYEISKDTINMINVKCHDMKYKLDSAINDSGISTQAFDDLRRSISIYDSNIETGNKLLNVLFTEKSLYCENNGISLTCMIDGKKLDFLKTGDLYCLFGNMLDNALEAVAGIKDSGKRIINVTVKGKDNMVIVQEENYYETLNQFENGLPTTTKADKFNHGFGMTSMRTIVHAYGGEMIVNPLDGVFRLTILFPESFNKQN